MNEPVATAPIVASNRTKRMWAVAAAVLILVALAAGAYWYWSPKEKVEQLPNGIEKVTAPSGRFVSGFPKALAVDAAGKPEQSYSLIYKTKNVSQPTATYASSKSYEDTIADFGAWLPANGWDVSRYGNAAERPGTFFYAYKDNTEVNIAITRDTDRIVVTISYVIH